MTLGRNEPAIPSRGHHDFGHVNVASGIGPDIVRRKEISGRARVLSASPSRAERAPAIKEAHPPPGGVGARSGCTGPHPRSKPELRHIDIARGRDENLAGTNDIRPRSDVLSVWREQLD